MNETVNNSQPDPVLNQIRAIVAEHFDSFLVVVYKDGQRWTTWKDDDSAFGMASFVCHNINKKWWEQGSKDIKT